MEEEYGCDEGERKDEDDERVTVEDNGICWVSGVMSKRERADDTYTLSPGESSVYSFNMVFDDPPAPAERDELGLETCDVPARRLQRNELERK
jgi:hypothetical protein